MSDCHFGVSPVNYPDPDPDDSVLNHFKRVIILSAKGPKRKPHVQLGYGICMQLNLFIFLT